jgi:hypothetical protein
LRGVIGFAESASEIDLDELDEADFDPNHMGTNLWDQCSRHDIPPAHHADLTDEQGHDLAVRLKALSKTKCSPTGASA